MYLQITERCNMTCEHCGMNCTEKGDDMSLLVLKKALEWINNHEEDEIITIGGGEPTLHPYFWQVLGLTLSKFDVWMATNGSITDTAIALAKLSGKNLYVALSQDYYHDKIDEVVIHAFEYNNCEIRDVSENLINEGRAKENGLVDLYDYKDTCICNGLFINPRGEIKPCGCSSAPIIGDVFNGIKPEYQDFINSDEYTDCECWTLANKKELTEV